MIPGTTELIIIFAVCLIIFGPSKLPKLGGAIGESIKNFRKGIKPTEEETLSEKKQQLDSKTYKELS